MAKGPAVRRRSASPAGRAAAPAGGRPARPREEADGGADLCRQYKRLGPHKAVPHGKQGVVCVGRGTESCPRHGGPDARAPAQPGRVCAAPRPPRGRPSARLRCRAAQPCRPDAAAAPPPPPPGSAAARWPRVPARQAPAHAHGTRAGRGVVTPEEAHDKLYRGSHYARSPALAGAGPV